MSEVAVDYTDVANPEYKAAASYFGQDVKPTKLLIGRVIGAQPADTFAARAREVAMEIANDATIALSEIKQIVGLAQRIDLHSAFETEAQAVNRTSRTKDNVAAIRVFGSKEKPVFSGE